MRTDRFFDEQPPIEFVEELRRPVHEMAPENFGRGVPGDGEVSVTGLYIKEYFPTDGELLATAYADFERFAEVTKIGGREYPILIKTRHGLGVEAFSVEVGKECTTVYAEECEGVRRALVYLEGEMTAREGAVLRLGTVSRRPYIKTRITRGFFSPTNRAPRWGDELLDDVDYYPDEYLNRLAHSATNGLWIYTSFRALIPTPHFPDDDREKAARRVEKLRRVVEKCKRYGVKVYVFAIEPHGLTDEAAAEHPEMVGGRKLVNFRPICTRTEAGRDYILRSVEGLFRAVPDLGGYIDITAGERPTSCASIASYTECPRCKRYSRGENLAQTVDLIKEGIRRAGTGAEFISWTYGHRYWDYGDVREYVRRAPRDVMLMQNFEDRGFDMQLGKPRVAYDYWLSYVGPSELFAETARVARETDRHLFAKMQVCCSHELATVPYIPVPGILYDKYRAARECGVVGVMECWYFGNYPSLMSRAAGELCFLDSFDDKDGFLRDFATRVYGKTLGGGVAAAWRAFEEGYRNYPTNIMFSYYGPMHDGVVWELSLIPKNNPLPRSWLLPDVPDGDRIGECLFKGHTLGEAITLAERMRDEWRRGLELLPLSDENELTTVARAIGLLLESGCNILSFYRLRGELGREIGDPCAIISSMRAIVLREMELSHAMIGLCEADKRLGYHSEAESFKFFPEKLRARIESLGRLLEVEFPAVLARIADGRAPLGYYYAEGEESFRLDGEMHGIAEGRAFGASVEGDEIRLDVLTRRGDDIGIYYEFELFSPECGVIIDEDAQGTVHQESLEELRRGLRLDGGATSHQSVLNVGVEEELSLYRYEREEADGGVRYRIWRRVPLEKWNGRTAIKLRLRIGESLVRRSDDPVSTLGKSEHIADEYVFLTPVK